MNPFEMVVLIVAVVMIASVVKARFQHRSRSEPEAAERAETLRLRDEVKQLKERLHVLERIATDRENTLERQIEELRDN